jgi:selenocysteine lyase/cysteine desulfurase
MLFTQALWDALSSMKRVRLYGPPPTAPRTPTISFTIEGLHADDVSRALANDALFASSGDFYAATVCERLNVDALLRVGCACYTTEEEVGRLISAVDGIVRRG